MLKYGSFKTAAAVSLYKLNIGYRGAQCTVSLVAGRAWSSMTSRRIDTAAAAYNGCLLPRLCALEKLLH